MRRLLLLVPWLGTWLVYRDAKRAEARLMRLLDDLNDIRLDRMEVRDSEILIELTRDSLAAKVWAGLWLELLDSVPAPNFIEFKFGKSPDAASWVVVTVQRVPGKTPSEKCREFEDALVEAHAALARRCTEPEEQ